MEKIIFENQHIKVSVLSEKSLLFVHWFSTSYNMDEDFFKQMNLLYLEVIEEYQLRFFLINATDFLFTITVEIQTWVAENIIPKIIELGLKRIGFVVSKELIAQLSIEQTMEEAKAETFTAYFDNEKQALKWLED